jgi:putative aminopeptidase FrvX
MPALAAAGSTALIITATASQYQHRQRQWVEERESHRQQQPPIVSVDRTWGVEACGRGANNIGRNIDTDINIDIDIDTDSDSAWGLKSARETSSSNSIAISTSIALFHLNARLMSRIRK